MPEVINNFFNEPGQVSMQIYKIPFKALKYFSSKAEFLLKNVVGPGVTWGHFRDLVASTGAL